MLPQTWARGDALPTIPAAPPASLVPGDTWEWYHTFASDFPAATYALTYRLIGPAVIAGSGTGWTFTPQSGSTYLVQVTAAATAAYTTPGQYRLIAFLGTTTPATSFTADERRITLEPAYRAVAGTQASHDERMVALLETAIAARLAGSLEESYSIGGRAIQKIPTDRLERMLGMYRARVVRQRAPGTVGRSIGATFA